MLKKIQKWHRTIGIICVIFIIMLATSGIILNHAEKLQLKNIHITNKHLLDWYKIQAKISTSYTTNNHWITQIGSQLYFNNTKIADHLTEQLIGAVSTQDEITIALEKTFLLLTENGEIIEKINHLDCLPATIKTIGTSSKGIVIRTTQGDYLIDLDQQHCKRTNYLAIDQARPAQPSAKLQAQLIQSYRKHGLSLEKLIIDIHSGRILGTAGILFIDMIALLFLILSISGIYLWLKHTIMINKQTKQQKKAP